MKVGDKIGHLKPTYGEGPRQDLPAYPGRIVYIHPQRRFYTVEFELPKNYHFRESFYFPNRSGPERRR